MFRKSLFLITVALMLVLSACGPSETPVPTPDMNALFTQVAETIAVEYTQTALAMPVATNTPEPTFTPPASPTVQPLTITSPTVVASPTVLVMTAAPTISATANGCYDAALVTDVTIPAGTKFDPGAKFEKVWRLANTGTCDWTTDFKITYVGGDIFGSDTTKIRSRVPVGNTKDITLQMVAPANSGKVVSNWQMATDTGELFGPVLSVSITLPVTGATATSVGSSTGGCYNAALVDETIPDGTEIAAGDSFTKTWTIQNTGTCDWNENFKFTFVGGNLFGSDTTKIRRYIGAGSTIKISLDMVAPSGSGTVTSSWRMADDSGNFFGQIFTVEIVLK